MNNSKMECFYMIYVDGSTGCKVQHTDPLEVRQEVERLAKKELGKKVFVLASVSYCQVELPEPKWETIEEPHFEGI